MIAEGRRVVYHCFCKFSLRSLGCWRFQIIPLRYASLHLSEKSGNIFRNRWVWGNSVTMNLATETWDWHLDLRPKIKCLKSHSDVTFGRRFLAVWRTDISWASFAPCLDAEPKLTLRAQPWIGPRSFDGRTCWDRVFCRSDSCYVPPNLWYKNLPCMKEDGPKHKPWPYLKETEKQNPYISQKSCTMTPFFGSTITKKWKPF